MTPTDRDARRTILHITTGLTIGGAENMLAEITARLDPQRFESRVISLTEAGPMTPRIRANGTDVRALEMRAINKRLLGFARLVQLIRNSKPDLVQTWLYHADLLGGLAAIGNRAPVVWNLRQSTLHREQSKRGTRLTVAACSKLSHILPDAVICGSESAYRVHASLGYATRKMRVITNGVDLDRFSPDKSAGIELRHELSVPADSPLVALIGRFDPQKDHRLFIEAAAKLAVEVQNVHFILCGPDVDKKNKQLMDWIDRTGFHNRFHLLGIRNDIARITAALDLSVSSSLYGEGFSNTLTEALACGVPCVTTDIGDSAKIVGDFGAVVQPSDGTGLFHAMQKILDRSLKDPGYRENARKRSESEFDINVIVRRYESLYEDLIEANSPSSSRR